MKLRFQTGFFTAFFLLSGMSVMADEATMTQTGAKNGLSVYEFAAQSTAASYDEAMAAACLQGIINRDAPVVYMLPKTSATPQYWLDTLSKEGGWLAGRERVSLAGLDALAALAGERLKGAVIWDPEVPASINVATTIAGVKDGVVLSPELSEQVLTKWKLPVIEDLRGRFTGAESGSRKNDAYRWALREYLAKGLCSRHLVCLFEDAATSRAAGGISYVVTRDWAVKNRSFVFDLSPWGDEKPKDDPDQPLGADLATYNQILGEVNHQASGKCMTEVTGFFSFWKYSNIPGFASKHEPVPTEWESVFLMTPYNCYQNTVSSDCYNQSFHSHAPFSGLKQSRPTPRENVEKKTYLCFLMADYDSATPLYDFMPKHWDDPNRGKLPLAWGINPNLIETYPDIITHLYKTATPNDHFTSDASCAGYFNPNRVKPEQLPLFVKHNQRFFDATDMSIAPMVLDWAPPTPAVKDAFAQFAPGGFATIVMDMHTGQVAPPKPHVWKGMPVTELINNIYTFASTKQAANDLYSAIKDRGNSQPGFYFFRVVWVSPSTVIDTLDILRKEHPEMPLEVLDPYTFFALFAKHYRDAAY